VLQHKVISSPCKGARKGSLGAMLRYGREATQERRPCLEGLECAGGNAQGRRARLDVQGKPCWGFLSRQMARREPGAHWSTCAPLPTSAPQAQFRRRTPLQPLCLGGACQEERKGGLRLQQWHRLHRWTHQSQPYALPGTFSTSRSPPGVATMMSGVL